MIARLCIIGIFLSVIVYLALSIYEMFIGIQELVVTLN
jgi:hypothetical protein